MNRTNTSKKLTKLSRDDFQWLFKAVVIEDGRRDRSAKVPEPSYREKSSFNPNTDDTFVRNHGIDEVFAAGDYYDERY